MKNYFSIDFESWAYPNRSDFMKLSSPERKKIDNGFVKYSAEKILKLLEKYKTKITFFILGELYEWYPEVIQWIKDEGHEIAYHTHRHDVLISPIILENTLKNSDKFINDFHPKGFRAPEIFFKKEYLPVIKISGFTYDSSVYGPYNLSQINHGIKEIPVSTIPIMKINTDLKYPRPLSLKMMFREPPIGSGYFLALLGKNTGYFIKKLNSSNIPFVGFLHNWQIVRPKNATFPPRGYAFSHPFYLPYTRDCYKIFEYLISNFHFDKMENLVK